MNINEIGLREDGTIIMNRNVTETDFNKLVSIPGIYISFGRTYFIPGTDMKSITATEYIVESISSANNIWISPNAGDIDVIADSNSILIKTKLPRLIYSRISKLNNSHKFKLDILEGDIISIVPEDSKKLLHNILKLICISGNIHLENSLKKSLRVSGDTLSGYRLSKVSEFKHMMNKLNCEYSIQTEFNGELERVKLSRMINMRDIDIIKECYDVKSMDIYTNTDDINVYNSEMVYANYNDNDIKAISRCYKYGLSNVKMEGNIPDNIDTSDNIVDNESTMTSSDILNNILNILNNTTRELEISDIVIDRGIVKIGKIIIK